MKAENWQQAVPTPCVGVCSTGIGDTVCRGCKRYAHEVIHWNGYTDEQKQRVMERLDRLLTQIVSAKLDLFDTARLRARLEDQRIRYSRHRAPAMWITELLKAGASQIQTTEDWGFARQPHCADWSLEALRDAIDREFHLLSEAHYERYILVRAPHLHA
ncbi:MAG: DUF1289 domain-containing protein [Spongiibacteraceae bacterium]|nr:DUF1289 domain-containing protein [Spongiibacteraceae bacterium]